MDNDNRFGFKNQKYIDRVIDKYLDKLDSYTFTFKYEDDHYVLVETAKK